MFGAGGDCFWGFFGKLALLIQWRKHNDNDDDDMVERVIFLM